MSSALKKNFEQFCMDYKTALEAEQEEGEDEAGGHRAADRRPDYELYRKLRDVNGKSGDQIVASMLSSVFDEDTKKVEEHLARYFELLIADGVLKPKDINKGLSRFADLLPELVLDCPQIHQYLMDYMIRPLQSKNIVQYKHISWKVEEPKKEGEEDDDIIFGTNPFFKLLALILLDLKKSASPKRSWQDVVTCFEKEFKWRAATDDKHQNLEEAEELWPEIKGEVGPEAAAIIVPLLDQAAGAHNKKRLQDALKELK